MTMGDDAADAARWRFVRPAFEIFQEGRRGTVYVICGSQWPVSKTVRTVDEALDSLIDAASVSPPHPPVGKTVEINTTSAD